MRGFVEGSLQAVFTVVADSLLMRFGRVPRYRYNTPDTGFPLNTILNSS